MPAPAVTMLIYCDWHSLSAFLYPRNEVGGVYWIHPVCLSVCLSVCPLTFRVRPVASTVQDGLFPYLVQMINSMRGCVACDDLWPWPISSRSFGHDLKNDFKKFSALTLKKNLQFSMDSFHIQHKWSLVWEGVLHIMTFDLDLYLQGHLASALKIVSPL